MGTEQSRIEELVERLRRESQQLFPINQRDGHAYHPTAFVLDQAADLLTHLKPVLEENGRYREALRDIANAIRCGAETDVMAWARLAEAQKGVARAALSQKGER
jgi:hypothetical protein